MLRPSTFACDSVKHPWIETSTPWTFSVGGQLGTNLRGPDINRPVDDETEKFIKKCPEGWLQSQKIKEAMTWTPRGNGETVKIITTLPPTCVRKHKTNRKSASTEFLRSHTMKSALEEPPIEIEDSDMRDLKIASPPPLVRKGSQLRQWQNRDDYQKETAALHSPPSVTHVHVKDMKQDFENSVPPDILPRRTAVTPVTARKNIAPLAPPKVVRRTKGKRRHKRRILNDPALTGDEGTTGMVFGGTLGRCPLAPVDHISLHCHEELTATDFHYSAEDWSVRCHSEMLLRNRSELIIDLAIQCHVLTAGVPDENEVDDDELKGYFGLM